MPEFLPGIELSRRYWLEVIKPVLAVDLHDSEWAAAIIGSGSEVLGFDTQQSADHGWGPRLLVFVAGEHDRDRLRRLDEQIDRAIPEAFCGFPTRFPARDGEPPRHQVRITTVPRFFTGYLGFDPTREIATGDWLATPTQLLRTVTAGAVFADGPGQLTEARRRLTWYPDDIWLYLLGCQWRRLDQEEPFAGRCHQVGDDLGATIVVGRLVRDLMRLCFLIERQYAPYTKWLGTAFSQLRCGPRLVPWLQQAVTGAGWPEREHALSTAFEHVATIFNALDLVAPQEPTVRPFYDRPFPVLGSGRFADACLAATALGAGGLGDVGMAGAIDQFVDSTDVLSQTEARRRLQACFWP